MTYPAKTTTVQIVEACPECGTSAVWNGTLVEPGGGTAYRVCCWVCDDPTVEPEPPAAVGEPVAEVVPERLAVVRQLQARFGRAS